MCVEFPHYFPPTSPSPPSFLLPPVNCCSYFGVSVTRHINSSTRMVLDSMRTLVRKRRAASLVVSVFRSYASLLFVPLHTYIVRLSGQCRWPSSGRCVVPKRKENSVLNTYALRYLLFSANATFPYVPICRAFATSRLSALWFSFPGRLV